jgi:hypothetical protein
MYYYHQLAGKDIEEIKANYIMSILSHIQQKENENYYRKTFELNEFTQKKRITHLYAGFNLFCLIQPYESIWGFSSIDYKRGVLANNNFCEHCVSKNKCEGVQKPVTKNDYIWYQKGLLDNFFSFVFRFLYLKKPKIEYEKSHPHSELNKDDLITKEVTVKNIIVIKPMGQDIKNTN